MRDGAALTHASTPALARTRKRPLEVVARPIKDPKPYACRKLLAAIGEDGGHLTVESSPIVMWLCERLAGSTR